MTSRLGEGVRVLVEERVQKAHWLLARVEPSLVEQGHHRCEGRRGGGGAANVSRAATDDDLVALTKSRDVRGYI